MLVVIVVIVGVIVIAKLSWGGTSDLHVWLQGASTALPFDPCHVPTEAAAQGPPF